MESLFRIAFWSIFGGMIILQLYFASRLRLAGEPRAADRKAIKRERWIFIVIRVIRSTILVVFLVLYVVNLPWLRLFRVPFPDWLRWSGAVLGVLSLGLYAWSRRTLGKEWSSCLRMREAHHLVTTGPYAWIRHPIYLAMMVFMTAITLIAANWFLIAFLVISIVDLALRIPNEEQMMIEMFGDEYQAYIQRTGKLLPKYRG